MSSNITGLNADMNSFASYVEGLVSGIILGWIIIFALYIYISQEKIKIFKKLNDGTDEVEEKGELSHNNNDADITEEERKVIDSALSYLSSLESTFNIIPQNPDTFGYQGDPHHINLWCFIFSE